MQEGGGERQRVGQKMAHIIWMNLDSNEIYFKIDFCSLFWASMVIVRTSPQGGTHGPNQGRGAQPHPPGGGSREAPARGGAQRPPRNGQKASRMVPRSPFLGTE